MIVPTSKQSNKGYLWRRKLQILPDFDIDFFIIEGNTELT